MKAVFLDRDGVLNEAVIREGLAFSPACLEDLVVVPDAASALGSLHRGGFRLVMATNQPDIARGKITRQEVDRMNGHLRHLLSLDAVEMCAHDDNDNCECRKPKPGMLLRAAQRDRISLEQSFMVGDRWRDIEAGRAAGCRTVMIGSGYATGLKSPPDVSVNSLTEAAEWILNVDKSRLGTA